MYTLVARNCDAAGKTQSYTIKDAKGITHCVSKKKVLQLAIGGQLPKETLNTRGNLNAAYIHKLTVCSISSSNKAVQLPTRGPIRAYTGPAIVSFLQHFFREPWRKRPEFQDIMAHCHKPLSAKDKRGHTLVIMGLRRTGKTVLMLQTMQALLDEGVSADEIVFITITADNTPAAELLTCLNNLADNVRYIFIDEATRCTDLLSEGLQIVDIYTGNLYKAHIVLSGTESFTFIVGLNTLWYGRVSTISTTHLSYHDYITLFDKRACLASLNDYITTAGTFDFEHVLSMNDCAHILCVSLAANICVSLRRNASTVRKYEVISQASEDEITYIVLALLARDKIYSDMPCKSLLSLVMDDLINKSGMSKPDMLLAVTHIAADKKKEYSKKVQIRYIQRIKEALLRDIKFNPTTELCDAVFDALKAMGTFQCVANLAPTTAINTSNLIMHDTMYIPTLYNVKYGFSYAYKLSMQDVAQQMSDVVLAEESQVTNVLYGNALENAVLLNCLQYFGYSRVYFLRFSYKQGQIKYTPEIDVVVVTQSNTVFLEVKYGSTVERRHTKNFEDPIVYDIISKQQRPKCYVVYTGETGHIQTLQNGLQVEWLNACELLTDLSILGEPKGDA